MAHVIGVLKLVEKLRELAVRRTTDADVSVAIGYTQSYAIYVHENLEARHPVGQAKFLEQPFRERVNAMAAIVRKALLANRTMAQALLLAGLYLQRESQLLVPVDTGALKGSAFTRLEAGGG